MKRSSSSCHHVIAIDPQEQKFGKNRKMASGPNSQSYGRSGKH
jgi:hypothetical protein